MRLTSVLAAVLLAVAAASGAPRDPLEVKGPSGHDPASDLISDDDLANEEAIANGMFVARLLVGAPSPDHLVRALVRYRVWGLPGYLVAPFYRTCLICHCADRFSASTFRL